MPAPAGCLTPHPHGSGATNKVTGLVFLLPPKLDESADGYQEPGPGRDLMHANHTINDVKWSRLRGRKTRKTEDLGGTIYLGVK